MPSTCGTSLPQSWQRSSKIRYRYLLPLQKRDVCLVIVDLETLDGAGVGRVAHAGAKRAAGARGEPPAPRAASALIHDAHNRDRPDALLSLKGTTPCTRASVSWCVSNGSFQ